MKVKNIIKTACNFVGNDDIVTSIENGSQNERIDNILKLFNLVRNEVVSEYMPMLAREAFEVKDLKVSFSSFAKKPLEIMSVKDKLGRNVKYKSFPDHFMTQASKVFVTYSFLPEDATLEDEIEDCLPERVYAYGLARECLLQEGMFEDAEIFEIRFKNSLKIFTRKKSEIILPRRRWI